MESANILKKLKINAQVRNIVLFVSDSLRWDYLPEPVAQRGVTFKTVASSLFTASSFPSMMTGLYPPTHGVHTFFDRLPKGIGSLLHLEGYNSSLWNENTWARCGTPESTPLHRLLRQNNRISLEDIATPFIYLENEKGGHCPYGWPFEDEDYEEWECIRFFRDHATEGRNRLRERYNTGIDRSVKIFEKRLDVLKERGIADDTLVVFTSDHGELLGEYGGHFGHGEIACPQVVYVPTVFIHPELPVAMDLGNQYIIRHVDLYPTIMDLLGLRMTNPVDGISMISVGQPPRLGFNYMESRMKWKGLGLTIETIDREASVWDTDSGYVFRSANPIARLLITLGRIIFGNNFTCIYLRRNSRGIRILPMLRSYVKAVKYYVSSHLEYGSPSFSKKDAEIVIRKYVHADRERIKGRIRELKRKGRI